MKKIFMKFKEFIRVFSIAFRIPGIIIFTIPLTLFIIWIGAFAILLGFEIETSKTDISEYLKTDRLLPDLAIFPPNLEEVDEVIDYHYYCGQLVDGDEMYLEAKYTHNGFLKEIDRLESLSDVHTGKSIKKDEGVLFNLMTYITKYNDFATDYEYACVEEESYTIVYVALSERTKGRIYFDEQYLPINYHLVDLSNVDHDSDPYQFTMYEKREDNWYDGSTKNASRANGILTPQFTFVSQNDNLYLQKRRIC